MINIELASSVGPDSVRLLVRRIPRRDQEALIFQKEGTIYAVGYLLSLDDTPVGRSVANSRFFTFKLRDLGTLILGCNDSFVESERTSKPDGGKLGCPERCS